MSKENETIPAAQHLAVQLSHWALDVNQFTHLKQQQKALQDIKLAYLTTNFADSNTERNMALVIFKQYEDLFDILSNFKPKHFEKLDVLTQKLQNHVLS